MNDVGKLEKEKNSFIISTDKSKLNISIIHQYLSLESYWSKNIPLAIVQKSIDGSICFGVYDKNENKQIGFARVITDGATFGYLADVFILPMYQGNGLGKWLMECIFNHTDLQNFRGWMLATKDAHGLYKKHGFKSVGNSERIMRKSGFTEYPINNETH